MEGGVTWGATERSGGRETVIRIHLKKKKIKFKKKEKKIQFQHFVNFTVVVLCILTIVNFIVF